MKYKSYIKASANQIKETLPISLDSIFLLADNGARGNCYAVYATRKCESRIASDITRSTCCAFGAAWGPNCERCKRGGDGNEGKSTLRP